MQCETVKVKSDEPGHVRAGFKVINKDDFDANTMELFEGPEAAEAPEAPVEAAPVTEAAAAAPEPGAEAGGEGSGWGGSPTTEPPPVEPIAAPEAKAAKTK